MTYYAYAVQLEENGIWVTKHLEKYHHEAKTWAEENLRQTSYRIQRTSRPESLKSPEVGERIVEACPVCGHYGCWYSCPGV